MGKPFIAIC